MRHELALVITGAAGIEVAPLLDRPERIARPGRQGFYRLDVVVAVDQERGLARLAVPGGRYHGGYPAGLHLNVGQPDAPEHAGQPDRTRTHLPRMLGLGAYRGETQQGQEAFQGGSPARAPVAPGSGDAIHG